MRNSFVDKELIKAYYLGTSYSYYYGLDECVLDALFENLLKLGPNPNPQPIPTSSSFIRNYRFIIIYCALSDFLTISSSNYY